MRQSSPGLIFILQGQFAFSEGFGPSLKEKRKYTTPHPTHPPPTNQKQFVFGQMVKNGKPHQSVCSL